MTFAVVSIHDVAPATRSECEQLVAEVERIGAAASLLVVPGPWKYPAVTEDPDFVDWLAGLAGRGHEIVVHGWEHRAVDDPTGEVDPVRRLADRILTRGCAEFGALGADEAARRASLALGAVRSLGIDPTGFVAPGWSMSRAATEGVRSVGYSYTATRLAIDDFATGRSIPAPAICHRPGSPLAVLGARMLVAVVEHRADEHRPVRLALHPADVHDDRLVRATRRAIAAIGRSRLETTTYAGAIEACCGALARPEVVNGGRR
jgi:predicted deacetylase